MAAPRRYACARCGRVELADRMLRSRFTRQRYCPDLKACERRARRREGTVP